LIIIINTKAGKVMSGWEKWKNLPERRKKEDRVSPALLKNFFLTINNSIRSVTNNALSHNNDKQIIYGALLKIFINLGNNVSFCFRKWRNVNYI